MLYFLELFPFLPLDLLNARGSESDLFLKCQIYFVEKSRYFITFTFFFLFKISFLFLCWNILEGRTKP